MKQSKILLSAILFGSAAAISGSASAFDLSNCDGFGTACPYVTYGDANSYSLMVNATIWDFFNGSGTGPSNPFYVTSTPGAIKDYIVIGTGASGVPVNTNFSGMDNAYPTPNDTAGTVFFTTNKTAYGYGPVPSGVSAPTDPTPTGSWDTPDTWDTSLAALTGTLGAGATPVFFFNNNQVNSGASTNQELAVWARITLTGAGLPDLVFDFTNRNMAFTDPGGGVFMGDPTAYTSSGAAPIAGDNSHTDYVLSGGAICQNSKPPFDFTQGPCPSGAPANYSTINNNLGADQAAYAIVVPELNNILLAANFNGYDSLHLDLRMGCDPNTTGYNTNGAPGDGTNCVGRVVNNGYEQLFIMPAFGTRVPEPGSLALMGLGLLGLGLARRRISSTR